MMENGTITMRRDLRVKHIDNALETASLWCRISVPAKVEESVGIPFVLLRPEGAADGVAGESASSSSTGSDSSRSRSRTFFLSLITSLTVPSTSDALRLTKFWINELPL